SGQTEKERCARQSFAWICCCCGGRSATQWTLASEDSVRVPFQKVVRGLRIGTSRYPDSASLELIIALAIIEIRLEPVAHADSIVGRHRDVAAIKERVDVRPQKEPIGDVMTPSICHRPDVRRIQHR